MARPWSQLTGEIFGGAPTAVENFIPATGHPNGDAVPVVSIQHQSSLGKVIRQKSVHASVSLLLLSYWGTCWSHRLHSLTVTQSSKHCTGYEEGSGQRCRWCLAQHEQEQKWYFHMFDVRHNTRRKLLWVVAFIFRRQTDSVALPRGTQDPGKKVWSTDSLWKNLNPTCSGGIQLK